MKAGIKTTEFYLSAFACILSLLLASGIIGDGTSTHTVASLLASSLSAIGYSCSRAYLKSKK